MGFRSGSHPIEWPVRIQSTIGLAKRRAFSILLCRKEYEILCDHCLGHCQRPVGRRLGLTKHSDNAQIATDAGVIGDFSNRLDLAQAQITVHEGMILTLSNSLAECTASSLAFSNQLVVALATNVLQADQITGLGQQLATVGTEKQNLAAQITGLTNQMAALQGKLDATQAGLDRTSRTLAQANQDYALLDNRFRRDVAERVVVERKFNNPIELKAQLQLLKTNPAVEVSAERIYAGLDVEVKSNGLAHVISPN